MRTRARGVHCGPRLTSRLIALQWDSIFWRRTRMMEISGCACPAVVDPSDESEIAVAEVIRDGRFGTVE